MAVYWFANQKDLYTAVNVIHTVADHCRELPQVSFLSRLNSSFVATKVCFSRQKFCRNKHTFPQTKQLCLSRQNIFATNICRDKTCFCRDKYFATTSVLLSRQKTCFIATNTCLSRQKRYFWHIPPNDSCRKFHIW